MFKKKIVFQVKQGAVTFDAFSMDEVIHIVRDNLVSDIPFVVEQLEITNITDIVKNMMKDNFTMSEIREKIRKEFNLNQFDSAYMDNDWELPYSFDLMFDIKSEGEIAHKLQNDGFLNDSLLEMALENGYSLEYLKNIHLNQDDI